jgi:hypothetical protein
MNPVKFFGKGVTYLGLGALFAMSIIGSLSIDIVILMAISKEADRNHRREENSFATGFLWGMMFSNNNSRHRGFYDNALSMMIFSLFLTGIAVILSVALGVPEVGFVLVAGWLGAFATLAAGVAIHALGEGLESFATWLIERVQIVTQEQILTQGQMPVSSTQQQNDVFQHSTTSDVTEQPYPRNAQTRTYDPRWFTNPGPTPSAPPPYSAPAYSAY